MTIKPCIICDGCGRGIQTAGLPTQKNIDDTLRRNEWHIIGERSDKALCPGCGVKYQQAIIPKKEQRKA